MFVFRFEILLTQRRHAEEALQKDLSEVRRLLVEAQSALHLKKAARHSCLQTMRRRQRDWFRAADILLFETYLKRLRRELAEHRKRVAAAEERVRQKRLELLAAMKKRKILEKLKEKDHAAYLKKMAGRERKFIDDIAGRMHARARR
jgi:flagellar FliJ protein